MCSTASFAVAAACRYAATAMVWFVILATDALAFTLVALVIVATAASLSLATRNGLCKSRGVTDSYCPIRLQFVSPRLCDICKKYIIQTKMVSPPFRNRKRLYEDAARTQS